MIILPASLGGGIQMGQGLECARIEAELWNRDSSDCGVGEVMTFNEDGAHTTYVGYDRIDGTTYKYGSVFKATTANDIGVCAMALETVKAGKKGKFLLFGLTTLLKYATPSGNLTHGMELTLDTSADGTTQAVSNVASSAGSSLAARPSLTGTNSLDAYTKPVRGFGKAWAADSSTPTAVSARTALFNGFGYWLGYGG